MPEKTKRIRAMMKMLGVASDAAGKWNPLMASASVEEREFRIDGIVGDPMAERMDEMSDMDVYVGPRSLDKWLKELDGQDGTILLNTPGGMFYGGSEMVSLIEDYDGTITAKVMGVAGSCGSWIMAACDKVMIARNALVMIHAPMGLMYGNAQEMRDEADVLDKLADAALATYAERMGEEDARKAMSGETWYTAEEALTAKLADSIMEGGRKKKKMKGRSSMFIQQRMQGMREFMEASNAA